LNAAFEAVKEERPGGIVSDKGGHRPKIYYATQVAVNPVTIMLSVNKPKLFEENYLRFIVGRLRSLLPISEVPIRLLARPHRKEPSAAE
jgi:GTP-binding protein